VLGAVGAAGTLNLLGRRRCISGARQRCPCPRHTTSAGACPDLPTHPAIAYPNRPVAGATYPLTTALSPQNDPMGHPISSAVECRAACCADAACTLWNYNTSAGAAPGGDSATSSAVVPCWLWRQPVKPSTCHAVAGWVGEGDRNMPPPPPPPPPGETLWNSGVDFGCVQLAPTRVHFESDAVSA